MESYTQEDYERIYMSDVCMSIMREMWIINITYLNNTYKQ